ncbi:hypothetical protein A3J41_02045 [candidate division TM6 bacterium RIFCSPHIGHO2_12_FULL_38_8]|nr:MAG: hypothetical protein A3J41_02045 [candidate division TM6 bacterium RIFCSPHIGHO2_12_FULL_38_8]
MKKLSLFFITLLYSLHLQNLLFPASVGFEANERVLNTAIAKSTQQAGGAAGTGTTPAAGGSCTPVPCTTPTSTTPFPAFNVSLFANSTATTSLNNNFNFTTSQTSGSGAFMFSNAMLYVHMFPPSNTISGSTITSSSNNESYAIMYTLKSLDGSTIQKLLQYTVNPAGTPSSPIMPISGNTPQIPTVISIAATAPTATTGTTFLPNIAAASPTLTGAQQQRIVNAISPICQKFLLTYTAGATTGAQGTLTTTPLSGTPDTDDGTALPVISSFPVATPGAASAKASPITVRIMDTTTPNPATWSQVAFAETKNPFTIADLAVGLCLNVHFFPPSTANTSDPYMIFATLRTLDGLKFAKQIFPATTLTTQPAAIAINYGAALAAGATTAPQFATVFVNPATSSNTTALNLMSPMNVRFYIQLNATTQAVTISML